MNVTHIITGLNNGGAEAVLYRLCVNDKVNKHIVISLMDMGKYGSLLVEQGIEVHCLNMRQGRVSFSGLCRLYRLLKNNKPDLVQTWLYHADLIGGLVAKFSGVKKVFWNIRQTVLESGFSKKHTIYTAKFCALLSQTIPDKIICCAHKAAKFHIDFGYTKEKIVVIGNGYELDALDINFEQGFNVKNEFSLNNASYILGMVGRYDPMKDHSNFLTALSLVKNTIPEFKCLLVGKLIESSNSKLVDEISRLGLQNEILLLGQRSDIPSIMNALDIHVLSSYDEGFPNVLAEAMACGTPCVTTNVGDADFIVGNTGWVVERRDSQTLADAIVLALNEKKNSAKWKLRQKSARKRIVENFSIQTMIDKYHAVWTSS